MIGFFDLSACQTFLIRLGGIREPIRRLMCSNDFFDQFWDVLFPDMSRMYLDVILSSMNIHVH